MTGGMVGGAPGLRSQLHTVARRWDGAAALSGGLRQVESPELN